MCVCGGDVHMTVNLCGREHAFTCDCHYMGIGVCEHIQVTRFVPMKMCMYIS